MAEKEYIEREALKSKLKNMEATSPNKVYQNAMEDMIYYFIPKIIDEIPSADVVEVVRCKNCEFYSSCSIEEYGDMKQNDFCSKGKRKEFDNG